MAVADGITEGSGVGVAAGAGEAVGVAVGGRGVGAVGVAAGRVTVVVAVLMVAWVAPAATPAGVWVGPAGSSAQPARKEIARRKINKIEMDKLKYRFIV